ncbi:MAG: hypothetical protein M1828_000630 [Chrysothrix sp. TS-e1954]|nr:MAG: hypothetical protein M1828_000630 [Chrysothrix sp. TS-e1954]
MALTESHGASSASGSSENIEKAVPVVDTPEPLSSAWQAHVKELSGTEKRRFQSFQMISLDKYVESIGEACQKQSKKSKMFRTAEWFRPLFDVVSMYMPIAMNAASAYPSPAPIILGGITCIVQLSKNFLAYQERMVRELNLMGRKMSNILQYNKEIMDAKDSRVELALVAIYGDVLRFCREALGLLLDSKGEIRGGLRTWSLSLYRPFDAKFGHIREDFDAHFQDFEDKARLCDRKNAQASFAMQKQHTDITISSASVQQTMKLKQDQHDLEKEQQKSRKLEIERAEKLKAVGKPGCGKSVLSALMISDLELVTEPGTALVYVYCKAMDPSARSYVHLATSLLTQLCQQARSIDAILAADYDRSGGSLASGPSWIQTKQAISRVMSTLKLTYIVVDGLDECEEHAKLADFLSDLVRAAPACTVKVLVTSRENYAVLERAFQDSRQVTVGLNSNEKDIKSYVDQFVNQDELAIGSDTDLLNEIKKVLLDKSENSFLWASLLVKSLKMQSTPNQIREAVKEVPPGLIAIYRSALEQICAINKEFEKATALNALLWVVHAARPLAEGELREAVAIFSKDMINFDDGNTMPSGERLRLLCANLVIRNNDNTFVLRHSSLGDYLRDSDGDFSNLPLSVVRQQDQAPDLLAEKCLTYLSLDNFAVGAATDTDQLEHIKESHPFLIYATTHWRRHCLETLSFSTRAAVVRLATSVPQRELAMQLYLDSLDIKIFSYRNTTTILHFICLFDLSDLLEVVSDPGSLVDSLDGAGHSALDLSLIGRSEAMCIWLAQNSKPSQIIKAENATHHSPLHDAVFLGWASFASMLISYGYNIERKLDATQQTPLMIAARHGDMSLVEILVNAGADLHATNASGLTALSIAANEDHQHLISFLVESGSDLNAQDNEGATALHHTVFCRNKAAVQLLLEHGADPNISVFGDIGGNALHSSAWGGFSEVLETLVRGGLDVNAVSGTKGYTAISMPTSYNPLPTIRSLLDLGADITMTYPSGLLRTHHAVIDDDMDVLGYLIDRFDIIDARSGIGMTCLHFAAAFGRIDTVQYLIGKGAALDLTDDDGHTALHLAVSLDHLETVEILLGHGASYETVSRINQMTPLMTALQNGHEPISCRLLDEGADCYGKSRPTGWTPVMFAALSGCLSLVSRLVNSAHVDVMAQNDRGQTALHIAAEKWSCEVLRVLCEANESIASIEDNEGRLALHCAAGDGNARACEVLLEYTDTDLLDQIGQSPLAVAVRYGHTVAARLLLQHHASPLLLSQARVSALHEAVKGRPLDVVYLMLDNGADATQLDEDGDSLLHAACVLGFPREARALVERLLREGCDALVRNKQGLSAFAEAVRFCRVELLKCFVANGMNGWKESFAAGTSHFELAVMDGDVDMMETLLGAGVDPLAVDAYQETAMHTAVRSGQAGILPFLHDLGLSYSSCNRFGETPLHIAALERRPRIVRMLTELAPSEVTDSVATAFGTTALTCALQANAPLTARALLMAGASPNLEIDTSRNFLFRRTYQDPEIAIFSGNDGLSGSLSKTTPLQTTRRRIIAQCAKSMIQFEHPFSVFDYGYRKAQLRSLLRALGHLPSAKTNRRHSINCLYEKYFIREASHYDLADCEFCGLTMIDKPLNVCMEQHSVLCDSCYEGAMRSGRMCLPDDYVTIKTLHRSIRAVAAAVDRLHMNLTAASLALWHLESSRQWIESQEDCCGAMKLADHCPNLWFRYHRNASSFMSLISNLMDAVYEPSEDKGSLIREQEAKYSHFQNDPAVEEPTRFVCLDHEFVKVTKEGCKKAKEEGFILDEQGRLRDEYLATLANDFEKEAEERSEVHQTSVGSAEQDDTSKTRSAADSHGYTSRLSTSDETPDDVTGAQNLMRAAVSQNLITRRRDNQYLTVVHESRTKNHIDSLIVTVSYDRELGRARFGKEASRAQLYQTLFTDGFVEVNDHINCDRHDTSISKNLPLSRRADGDVELSSPPESSVTTIDRPESTSQPNRSDEEMIASPKRGISWFSGENEDLQIEMTCEETNYEARILIMSLYLNDIIMPGFAAEYCRQRYDEEQAFQRRLQEAYRKEEAEEAASRLPIQTTQLRQMAVEGPFDLRSPWM